MNRTIRAFLVAVCVFLFGAVSVSADPGPAAQAVDVSGDEMQFDVNLTGYEPEAVSDLTMAVWSEKGGQDDLKWYRFEEAEEGFTAHIPVSKHKTAGLYYADIYDSNGGMTFVAGTTFNVTNPSCSNVYVDQLDNAAGTCTVIVEGVNSPSGIKEVVVPVWCASDQSDLKWYAAQADGAGNYTAEIDVANHKYHAGTYNADVYVTGGNGIFTYVGGTSALFERKSAAVTAAPTADGYQIDVTGIEIPGGLKRLSYAVWSDKNGQDDLKWFESDYDAASQSSSVSYKSTAFKTFGLYYVDVYGVTKDGQMVFLGGTTYSITAPSADGMDVSYDNAAGTFVLTVKGVKSDTGIKSVVIPTWSKPDQSDICWHQAKPDSDGNYVVTSDISKHKYNVGTYYADAYVTDDNGYMSYVCGGTMTFSITYDSIVVGAGTDEKTYPVTIKNLVVPAGAKSVIFPTWSDAKGQDDIQWYKGTASGNDYSITVDITKHKTAGDYLIDIYALSKNGDMIFIGGTKDLKVNPTADASMSVSNIREQEGKFDVTVTINSSSSGVKSVVVPVWCASNQSDLQWYAASKQSDGTYKITVDVSKHKYNLGNYKMDAYVTFNNGIQKYVCGTTQMFNPSNFLVITKTSTKGQRVITLKNVSASVSKVTFPVWSNTGGQDDLTWNQAKKQSDGSWQAVINAGSYKHYGTFIVHAYADNAFVANKTFEVDKGEMAKNGWYYENGYKFYYVNDVKQTDVRSIIGPQSSYYIEVNRVCNTMTIYAPDGGNGYIIPVCAFACSVGLPGTPTPTGTFYTDSRYRWKYMMGPSWAQYATGFLTAGGYYMHSVAGWPQSSYNLDPNEYNKLGSAASHGCVRLCVRDAKWIFDNCSLGTRVYIYDGASPGPLGKPALIKIPPGQNWDPTDPNI